MISINLNNIYTYYYNMPINHNLQIIQNFLLKNRSKIIQYSGATLSPLLIYYLINKFYKYYILYRNYDTIAKFKRFFATYLKYLPFVRKYITDKIKSTKLDILDEFNQCLNENNLKIRKNLPQTGFTDESIINTMTQYRAIDDSLADKQKISGTIYSLDDNHSKLLQAIFPLYLKSNPLHPDTFPCLRKMELDIIKITLGLFHGNHESVGCLTAGGTESILLACKAYSNLGKTRNIKHPEMIVPLTVHAAFDKAADYYNIKIIKVPVDKDTDMPDLDYIRASINSNTVLIVGSAPGYPHGIIDPIKELSDIAIDANVGLHIDCCLGGFILPFIQVDRLYDFQIEGVTSISADLHKYGNSPKGVSILMYNNRELMKQQFFVQDDWMGGIYATSTTLGSRSGNNIAMSWATMMHYGIKGYRDSAKMIDDTCKYFVEEIEKMEHIEVIGKNPKCAVGIRCKNKNLDIYEINGEMKERGWNLNALQFPPSIHICVTKMHNNKIAKQFIQDLTASVKKILENGEGNNSEGKATIYGSSQKVSDRNIIKLIAKEYLDCYYWF